MIVNYNRSGLESRGTDENPRLINSFLTLDARFPAPGPVRMLSYGLSLIYVIVSEKEES